MRTIHRYLGGLAFCASTAIFANPSEETKSKEATILSGEALTSAVEKLLASPLRPRIADIEAYFGDCKGPNPFRGQASTTGNFSGDYLRQRLMNEMPKLIAAYELSFPGATFYGLGRDVEMLLDAVDAFYRSTGQNDRVRRLGASAPSFKDQSDTEANDPMILGFMASNGVEVENLDKGAPAVVVDISSWRPMSQLRQVQRAIYRAWTRSGKSPRDLVHHFNVIATGFSFPNSVYDYSFDFDKFFRDREARATEEGVDQPVFIPHNAFTYTMSWHEIFREFTKDEEGHVYAPAGGPLTRSTREGILAEMYEMRKTMGSPEFLSAVQQDARDMGYVFPTERVFKIERTLPVKRPEPPKYTPPPSYQRTEDPQQWHQDWQDEEFPLPGPPPSKPIVSKPIVRKPPERAVPSYRNGMLENRLSAAGRQFVSFLRECYSDTMVNDWVLQMVEDLADSVSRGSADAYDLQFVLFESLGHIKYDDNFVKGMRKVFVRSPDLRGSLGVLMFLNAFEKATYQGRPHVENLRKLYADLNQERGECEGRSSL